MFVMREKKLLWMVKLDVFWQSNWIKSMLTLGGPSFNHDEKEIMGQHQ